MKKVIKIGFPILCLAVIGGTFILLNKTTQKINRNKLPEENITEDVTNTDEKNDIEENIVEENVVLNSEEAKTIEIENKAKAIELVKKLAPPTTNVYYTNEGTVQNKYLVAIRDNDTKNVNIYYIVDVENEKIKIYEK